MLLRARGHDVRTAYDGKQGLAAAEDYRPGVLILDIGLPGLDGYAVARALRALPLFRTALLIALTGYAPKKTAGPAIEPASMPTSSSPSTWRPCSGCSNPGTRVSRRKPDESSLSSKRSAKCRLVGLTPRRSPASAQ